MEMIKVLIVEDDRDWLRGLGVYLGREADIEIVGTANTAEEAMQAIRTLRFDVVLMDIMLASQAEGIWLTSKVCESCRAKVLMLTSMEQKELIFEAFQAGATDYLLKSAYEEIPAAIRAAYHSRSGIHSSVADQMREEFRRLKQLEREYRVLELKQRITPTELQILRLIDKGHTQTDIARQLVVSLRTVKVHVGNILRKLGGRSSKEAARQARDMGLFGTDDASGGKAKK
jgi:two-component system vancomycin resistance associated response regulator VraR